MLRYDLAYDTDEEEDAYESGQCRFSILILGKDMKMPVDVKSGLFDYKGTEHTDNRVSPCHTSRQTPSLIVLLVYRPRYGSDSQLWMA